MAKNKGIWIIVILLIIGGIFYYNIKKEVPTGAGYNKWVAQEFTSDLSTIKQLRLSIRAVSPTPDSYVEIYIANKKEIKDSDAIIYSYTYLPASKIQGTGDYYTKVYDINDAEVSVGQKLYLVIYSKDVNNDGAVDYAIMTNPNYLPGGFWFSFDYNPPRWLDYDLNNYDVDFNIMSDTLNCKADLNCDNNICFDEILSYVQKWVSGTVIFDDALSAVQKWTSQLEIC